jgi:sugar (pentulose or hexulose) kinase
LMVEARSSPPGARGVTATPWLGGARAPWWRDQARAALVGLGFEHTTADIARAALEAIAHDAMACMHAIGQSVLAAPAEIAGSVDSTRVGLWLEILAAMTGLPVVLRRVGEAASAGAAIIGANALGSGLALDDIDPVRDVLAPDPVLVDLYAGLLPHMADMAVQVLALGTGEKADAGTTAPAPAGGGAPAEDDRGD